jgi:hypothetical protein
MYRCHAKRVSRSCTNKKQVIMMLVDERRGVQRDAERCADVETGGAAREIQPTSPGPCEVMLKVLCRDDSLRRSYLRRRWQGLAR